MKYLKLLILATSLLLGLASTAQTIEIPPTLSAGDSLRIVTKSGLYNYGTLQSKTDSSLLLYLDNQKVVSTFYISRIAEVFVFTKAKPIEQGLRNPLGQTENRKETFGKNVYGRGSSVAALRVGDEVEIRTIRGNYYKGIVDRNMVMRIDLKIADNKIIFIPKDEITYMLNSRDKADKMSYEETKLEKNAAEFNRYFFAPSAIKPKKGSFSYDNSYAFVNSLTYSPTDFLSVTAGAELISTLIGRPIYMLSPHVGFKVGDQFYIGGGYIYGGIIGATSETINAFYGTATLGNANKNVTVNLGTGLRSESSYTLNVSGYLKVSKNFGLISENWFFTNDDFFDSDIPFLGFGGRLYGAKVNFDFALVNLVIPYLGFSCKF
ncbi:MAG: hypothetical protein ACOVK9_04510 [Bacteroidia bacterium]